MNFLAHFHLAWPDEGLIVGGLEGEYYKGPLRGDLPRDLERGVRLHRAIDAYTDAHPRLKTLRRGFPTELRRYAGILIDLSFDHFLSLHWQRFSAVPLSEFNAAIYDALTLREADLGCQSRDMYERLLHYDILGLYAEWETVTATAERIGRRFRRHNPFAEVSARLTPCRDLLEQAFLDFYPELETFCQERRQILSVQ